jgi:hypothetical protein
MFLVTSSVLTRDFLERLSPVQGQKNCSLYNTDGAKNRNRHKGVLRAVGCMLPDLAQTYSEVFAPEFFVLICSLLIISHEWRPDSERSLAGLGARVGVLGLGWAVAFAIYRGVPRLVRELPEWGTDFTGSAGLGVGILLIWVVWQRRDWGDHVPTFSMLLVGVTIPHLLIARSGMSRVTSSMRWYRRATCC